MTKVGLVCTGSPCRSEQELSAAIVCAKQQFSFEPVVADGCLTLLPAGQRAQALLAMLTDPSIDFIWSLRGGEGSADLLPYLHQHHKTLANIKEKPIISYSDGTAMLLYFAQQFGWHTIHGPAMLQFSNDVITAPACSDFKKYMTTLYNKDNDFCFPAMPLKPLNLAAQQTMTLTAELTGGNLSLVAISIKDLWEIDTKNKIIMLEDVGEPGYKVGRALKYLQRINKFSDASALIFGDFGGRSLSANKEDELAAQQQLQRTLNWFAGQCDIPVLQTNAFGHAAHNFPFIFNALATLTLGATPSLRQIASGYFHASLKTREKT